MSVFILKLIALITMIIDHIGYFFISNNLLLRIIGRLAAPIFMFLFVESYYKTSNKKRFQKRLFISSMIMFLGNFILSLFLNNMYPLNTNILFTMFLGTILLDIIKNPNDGNILGFVKVLIISYIFNYVEYGFLALICILIYSNYIRKNYDRKQLLIGYVFLTIFCIFIEKNYIQAFMFMSILPISLYNGQLGYHNKFIKYFYYSFYIIHLWLFVILKNIMI